MSDAPNTYMKGCDVCEKAYPKTDEWTVQWANLEACSRACKQEWQNKQQTHL